MLLRGVHDERAPATADVQKALPGLEVELAADHLALVPLGLLERVVRAGEVRAGVRHRRVEQLLVEVVADVVVVLDRALGAAQVVERPLLTDLRCRWGRRTLDPGGAHRGDREPRLGAAVEVRCIPGVDQAGERVEVVDLEFAGHVRASKAKLAGCGEEVGDRARRPGVNRRAVARGGGQRAAVPEGDAERPVGEGGRQFVAQRGRASE